MGIEDLYKAAQNGGKIEENTLFSNLSEIFYLFLRHKVQDEEDCQEILQEVLMAIAEKYKQTEFTVGFSAWAYSILRNKLANYFRSKIKDQNMLMFDISDNLSSEINIDPNLENRLQICLKKVHKRNLEYIRILNLRFLGFGIDEISQKIKRTRGYIYLAIFRARQMLKNCLEGEDKYNE